MAIWKENFNGEIDNQSPELYEDIFILIHRVHSLVNDGHDLWTEFDNDVPEIVKFWEDVAAKIRDVAKNFNVISADVRTIGDVYEEYAQVIALLTRLTDKDAEDRLNKIFRRDQYEIKRK
jgi:ubiquinone biosynthesis protein UbiJ